MTRKYHEKPITHIGNVSLNVLHLERSLTYYKNVIGYQLLEKNEQQAILTVDGQTPSIILNEIEDVIQKKRRTTGLYHFAILLPKRNYLANFLQHLLSLNIPFGASDHSVSEAIYLDDPDGNGIEVYCDRPDVSWKQVKDGVHMATDRLNVEELLQEVDRKWSVLPRETLIGHVHLHVTNLAKTEHFYKAGLNLDLMARYPGALFMSAGGYHHHLGLNTWNGADAQQPPKNSVGLNWLSIVVANHDKREQIKEQLVSIGAAVTIKDDYYETVDPSGNVIRLIV